MEAVIPETNPKEEKFVEEKDVDVQSKQSANDSEYDSVGSYSENNDDRVKSRQSDGDNGSVSETEGSVGLERESGDGQESVPNKKVDDDEDKKNPQYIPKRGTFYEHDDRTAEDNDNLKNAEVEEKEPKKKVWQDKKERWSHDRFNDTEQAPKSRAELVAIYGYDIRNEDGPPRARRRRRYGRGPNKYTRNWEDEDAYSKPPPNRVRQKQRKPNRGGGNIDDNSGNNQNRKPNRTNYTGEDFPQLSGSVNTKNTNNTGDNRELNRQDDRDNRQSSERSEGETNGNVHTPTTSISNDNASSSSSLRSQNHDNNQSNKTQNLQQQQQRVGSGRVIKPKREIKDSDYRGFTTKTRQYRNLKTEQKIIPKGQQPQQQSKRNDDFIQSQNFTNKNNSQDLDKDMSKLNIQDTFKNSKHGGNNGGNNQRQGSVPPRLQVEQKGSKRYSSIRQRSLPESQTPPFNQHSNYYPNEYNQQNQVTQQTIIHQQNTQIHPSTNQVPPPPPPQIAPPPLPQIPAQVPVTAATILQAPPPQFAPPFPQGPPPPPPPYLQASVAGPPTFLPQQTPQIINYVPSQQFTQSYQGYQQQYNPVTQPTELFQQPSGITYYSTDQQVTQRAMVQKRPKAAIPIVAPPQSDSKDNKKDEIISPTVTSTEDSDIVENTINIDNNSNNNNNNSNTDDNTNSSTIVEQETVQQ